MPQANKCTYCKQHRKLYFTGRSWICELCWKDHFGEYPPEEDALNGS